MYTPDSPWAPVIQINERGETVIIEDTGLNLQSEDRNGAYCIVSFYEASQYNLRFTCFPKDSDSYYEEYAIPYPTTVTDAPFARYGTRSVNQYRDTAAYLVRERIISDPLYNTLTEGEYRVFVPIEALKDRDISKIEIYSIL
jgi:hypothetical protein